jgi:hypothetical protein
MAGKGMKRALKQRERISLDVQISQADLIGNVVQRFVAHQTGRVGRLFMVAQLAITTGGTIQLQKNGVNVTGAIVTFANAAPAGNVQSIKFNKVGVVEGDVLSLVLTGFATAGAVNGVVGLEG